MRTWFRSPFLIPTFIVCAGLLTLSSGRGSLTAAVAEPDERRSPPDPCQLESVAKGRANGLDRRCRVGGGGGAARGDFNGDGIADLAVGAPFEDQDGIRAVGGVHVIYGSSTGLTATGDLFLDAVDFGLPYGADQYFGWALASGNFNGDDYSDLAISMPWDTVNGQRYTGRVVLIDGSPTGLALATVRTLPMFSGLEVEGAGHALVWADFNGDTFADLAVGVPYADFGGCAGLGQNEGEVQVFYGGPDGLQQAGGQRIRQGSVCDSFNPFIPANTILLGSGRNMYEYFGWSLAAGNFNGDVTSADVPLAELAIGVPNDMDGSNYVGRVHVLKGTINKLQAAQSYNQNSAGIGGGAENDDDFGFSLAVGDFDADLHDDLVIGVPGEDLLDNTAADAGAVHVLLGSHASDELVTTQDSLFITQNMLPGTSTEAGDRFGWSLTTGRFDDDFRSDLAIGSPGEDVNTVSNAGMVQVLYGSSSGPSLSRVQNWHQNIANIPDTNETRDEFGAAISAWNYGRSSHADLAIGVPLEDLLSASTGTQQVDAGAVIVIYGSATGLAATSSAPAQQWHQDTTGIGDTAQAGDQFGRALY
jgi:hypothetical protein